MCTGSMNGFRKRRRLGIPINVRNGSWKDWIGIPGDREGAAEGKKNGGMLEKATVESLTGLV